jgi:hypothetical protein
MIPRLEAFPTPLLTDQPKKLGRFNEEKIVSYCGTIEAFQLQTPRGQGQSLGQKVKSEILGVNPGSIFWQLASISSGKTYPCRRKDAHARFIESLA